MLQIIKNYCDDKTLRCSFNQLAQDTFGLDFEDWYQNGYWTERYIPYSIVIDGKVCANVSVNRTWFAVKGGRKHWLQLGTVMTAEDCRHQGLIRLLMEEIERDYAGRVDGMYLFAGDEVLEFYPKFGFRASQQYEYVREITPAQDKPLLPFIHAPQTDKAGWDMLQARIQNSHLQGALEMLDNSQLHMFYISKFMQECVYYCEVLDTYVIAELDGHDLILHQVISEGEQDLAQIADSVACCMIENIRAQEKTAGEFSPVLPCKIRLGFTPRDSSGFTCNELDQTDCMFFIRGDMDVVEQEKMMIPTLAHA